MLAFSVLAYSTAQSWCANKMGKVGSREMSQSIKCLPVFALKCKDLSQSPRIRVKMPGMLVPLESQC